MWIVYHLTRRAVYLECQKGPLQGVLIPVQRPMPHGLSCHFFSKFPARWLHNPKLPTNHPYKMRKVIRETETHHISTGCPACFTCTWPSKYLNKPIVIPENISQAQRMGWWMGSKYQPTASGHHLNTCLSILFSWNMDLFDYTVQ
jgi:hypothetical protein